MRRSSTISTRTPINATASAATTTPPQKPSAPEKRSVSVKAM
ncbi:hypothetical protein ACVWYH_010007 [Bradyrhizobium sp. GM24.11]